MPTENNESRIEKKIDTVVRLLEDLFILQALTLGIGRDDICSAIGVHTTRVSNVRKGLSKVKRHVTE